jgi:hypothetical protein
MYAPNFAKILENQRESDVTDNTPVKIQAADNQNLIILKVIPYPSCYPFWPIQPLTWLVHTII